MGRLSERVQRRASVPRTDASPDKLGLRETCRLIAGTYRRHLPFLLATALVIFAPVSLLDALSDSVESSDLTRLGQLGVLTLVLAAALNFLTSTLGEEFYAGAAVAAIKDERAGGGERHGLGRLLRTIPFGRLIVADLLFTVGTTLGLLLFVVPGVVVFTYFVLTTPVIKLEDRGVRDGFRRSRELVEGNFWLVLALLGSLYLASDLATTAAQDGAVWAVGDTFLGDWAAALVVAVAISPIYAVAAVVLTLELIERKGASLLSEGAAGGAGPSGTTSGRP